MSRLALSCRAFSLNALAATAVALAPPARAAVVGKTEFGTVGEAIAALGTPFYTTINPSFSETAPARFNFGTGTRRVRIGYLTSNLGEIVVRENGVVIGVFNAGSRTASEAELKAFLTELFKADTGALQLQVANTPSDPVAGSPASLQARMVDATFQNGSDVGPSARTGGSRAAGTLGYPHLGLALQSGRYKGPGFSANIQTTPLGYSIPLDDPRWALKFDMPISFSQINGEENLSGSFGVGLRIPVYDHWTLTPELRVGITRNRSRDITAKLLNASIVSNYRVPMQGPYAITVGNSLTFSTTFGSPYDQENVYNKNGIEVSGPFEPKLYGLPTTWEFSVVHTKVGGDPVFVDEWVDVSLSVGTIASKNGVTFDSVRVGVTYTRANRGIEGININFGYEF